MENEILINSSNIDNYLLIYAKKEITHFKPLNKENVLDKDINKVKVKFKDILNKTKSLSSNLLNKMKEESVELYAKTKDYSKENLPPLLSSGYEKAKETTKNLASKTLDYSKENLPPLLNASYEKAKETTKNLAYKTKNYYSKDKVLSEVNTPSEEIKEIKKNLKDKSIHLAEESFDLIKDIGKMTFDFSKIAYFKAVDKIKDKDNQENLKEGFSKYYNTIKDYSKTGYNKSKNLITENYNNMLIRNEKIKETRQLKESTNKYLRFAGYTILITLNTAFLYLKFVKGKANNIKFHNFFLLTSALTFLCYYQSKKYLNKQHNKKIMDAYNPLKEVN